MSAAVTVAFSNAVRAERSALGRSDRAERSALGRSDNRPTDTV